MADLDLDLDLDDLDDPIQAPTRTSRFAPKNTKFKPKPKPKTKTEPPPSQSQELDSIPLTTTTTTKEELDSKPFPVVSTTFPKIEFEPSAANGIVSMDIEAKPEPEERMSDPMEEDGDEDKVVREIDVFFTPQLDSDTQLYVLQYPLKPYWRPYELDERCEEVRVKTVSSEVEIDLSVDVDSRNYDQKAEEKVRMTKQILSSSWKPPCTTGHAVGVLMGNKLHLSPIHAVVQLRPSMQHFKSGGSRKQNNINSNVEELIKSEDLKERKSMGPSKKQNKQPGVLNELNKEIGECWVPLKYHGAKSDVSARYLEKMVAQEDSHIQFSMSPYDYVNSLCPGTLKNHSRPKGPPKRLLSLPLEDRYKTWFLEGPPVHRFDALKHLAPDESVEDVLGVLQKLAQLVQGLWVPKSSLLYGRDTGVEVLARDYTLLLFSKKHVIERADLQLGKAMKDALNELAVERPSCKDWKFKEPRDESFIKRHPNIVKEQKQAWERLDKLITDHVFGGRKTPGMKNSLKSNTYDKHVAPKNSNKAVSKTLSGAPSKRPMSDETREALPKALQKLFQIHKVCSEKQIGQRLREMAVSESSRPKGDAKEAIAAANGADAPQEELLAIVSQFAINIHGVFVSKSSSGDRDYNELREVVIDLLIGQGPDAKLKKAAIIEAAHQKLKREISFKECLKVLNELCISQGSAWVLKRGDGSPK